jgi:hypothetical protein
MAQSWKQLCPSANEWINEILYAYNEYCQNEILACAQHE